MSNRKFVIFLGALATLGAALIFILRDDMELQQTSRKIKQIEITKPIEITTQTLQSGQANGYTHNEDLILLSNYPPIFPSFLSYFDRFRVKMWDYFYFVTDRHMIGFSINQVMNFGSALFMLYDLQNPDAPILHHTEITLSNYELPAYAYSHNVNASFTSDKLSLFFSSISRTKKIIKIKAPVYGFEGELEFSYKSPHHTITTVNPASEENRVNFSFGTKVYCIEANGAYTLNGKEYEVKKAVAMHDHGRGTPPYRTMWVWGSLNAKLPDGRMLGANFGTGDKPGISFTTDAIFINGEIHKLGVVNVFFNNQDVLKQNWKIKTMSAAPGGTKAKMDLEFEPLRKIMNGKNYLVVKVDLMNVYGYFSGKLTLNNGEVIQLKRLPGFMERNYARW